MERYLIVDTQIANQYGLAAAVIYALIKNEVKAYSQVNMNYFDGRHWVRKTQAELSEQLPYWKSRPTISTALNRLVSAGYLVEGVYNEEPFDQTRWYSVTELGEENH